MCHCSALPIVAQEDDLIQPHAGDHERAAAMKPFARTSLQVARLDDSLKQQFNGLFAISIQVMLETAPLRGQLRRRQQPAACLSVALCQSLAAEGRVTKQNRSDG